MELRYPFLIIVIIIGLITYFIFVKRKKGDKYKEGSKIANTKYIKATGYYQKKLKEYKILKRIVVIIFAISILCSSILIVRLAKIETVNKNQYNRDIFLCMDASFSVNKLNLELVDKLIEIINKLHGERFGVSIFNTSSIVLVPLTDDYNYVINTLEDVKKSIRFNLGELSEAEMKKENLSYLTDYIISGTIEDHETRGSSLIGDGLASCAFNFTDTDEDRTRIIIFTTDNDLLGTPLVSLDKAANISKNKNIKVFGIATQNIKTKDRTSYKNAIEKNGGKFYDNADYNVNEIVSDIEATSKSLLKNQMETKELDIPEIPFFILLFSVVGIIFVSKKVTI